ncbi:(2Fe-2S)-binding protein (modular protein) [Methylacidimicrobium sp. AP8]|uniref:Rieske (2Fe-2S) protein n=1 Tax=Methylacidimicrobium sp. AP8 TaxID=2730359 RepID=UPI0018C02EA2|nr:nitrite reductase (NAD(P)H) small subunit [Methylacidimicrobium sp. AP8]CAB4243365.1 (2Fe-2S)-binding protein (modular protein) [Methylacidimicrobium sp. AP8]
MTQAISPGKDVWLDLGRIDRIPVGQGRCFQAGGRRIAVFRLREGGLRALDAVCPHQAGMLSEGILDREKVLCPLHGFAFSLRTGEGLGHPLSVRSYEVRSSDGRILAKIPLSQKPFGARCAPGRTGDGPGFPARSCGWEAGLQDQPQQEAQQKP